MSKHIPVAPLALGLAGLIPFWGLALALFAGGGAGIAPDKLASALASYGAIILSFLGGIRWGFAVRERGGATHYAISVVPSLVAWTALAAPQPWRLAGLGAMALVMGPLDRALVEAGIAPVWFGRLRMILSLGAGAALVLGAVAVR